MKENNTIKNFDLVLKQYKFKNNIPKNIIKFESISSYKNFKIILKKVKNYSVIFGIIISIQFFLKKLGINISISMIKVILLFSSIATISVPFSILSYNYITDKNRKINNSYKTEKPSSLLTKRVNTPIDKQSNKNVDTNHQIKNIASTIQPIPVILISKFETLNLSENLKVEDIIFNQLSKNLKNNKITTNDNTNSKLILTGRVIKLENYFMITTKVIKRSDSSIMYSRTMNVENIDEIKLEINKISHEIESIFLK